MKPLAQAILHRAHTEESGAPFFTKDFRDLGARAGVQRALARLVREGLLLRVARGTYVRPRPTRFGLVPPDVAGVLERLGARTGERMAPHGALSANALGLTTQVPVRLIYLTSGRSRHIRVGRCEAELRHAPEWQLLLPRRPAGMALRALASMGPDDAQEALPRLRRLPLEERRALASIHSALPGWLARVTRTLLDSCC